MTEERYIVSVVAGTVIRPGKSQGDKGTHKKWRFPVEASVLDTFNCHKQVHVVSSHGHLTQEMAVARAEEKCRLLNREERAWENGEVFVVVDEPGEGLLEPDEGLMEPFSYMCEHCPATVTLYREEFDAVGGRVMCAACRGITSVSKAA